MRRLFLILGVILGALVALGIFFYVQLSRPSYVSVPVAIELVPAGTVLDASQFRVVDMANVDADTQAQWIISTEFPELAQGKPTTSDIRPGFPIGKSQIDVNAPTGIETRLSVAITGTKDYYVVLPTSPEQVGNYIQPGDRVDMLISIGGGNDNKILEAPITKTLAGGALAPPPPPPGLDTGVNNVLTETVYAPISKLVMQNMQVLRIDRAPSQNGGQTNAAGPRQPPSDVRRLYIKVDRDQLEVLSFVMNNGKQNIAVRASTGSTETLPTEGVTWGDFARWFFAQRNNKANEATPFTSISPYSPTIKVTPTALP